MMPFESAHNERLPPLPPSKMEQNRFAVGSNLLQTMPAVKGGAAHPSTLFRMNGFRVPAPTPTGAGNFSPPTGRRKHQPPPPYAGTQVTEEISLNSRHSFCQLSPRSSLRYK